MALIVHKYGGTSMGSTERIRNVAKRVAKWVRAGHQLVVVPSAMSGETNRLLGLASKITDKPRDHEIDVLLATGEQVSIALLALVAMFGMLAMYSDLLPERIPIHWDAGGAPDRWGGKETIWIFPFIGAVIYAGLSVAGAVKRATQDPEQHELMGQLLAAVKVVTMVSFAIVSRGKLEAALGHGQGLSGILALVMVVLMAGGLLERDGLFVVAAYAMFAAGVLYIMFLGEAATHLMERIGHWFTG